MAHSQLRTGPLPDVLSQSFVARLMRHSDGGALLLKRHVRPSIGTVVDLPYGTFSNGVLVRPQVACNSPLLRPDGQRRDWNMFYRNVIAISALTGSAAIGLANATTQANDTYAGGAAIAYLPQEFVLGGANPLGVNFAFDGNPFNPIVNGGFVPLYDPQTYQPTNLLMEATSTVNSDGSYTVAMTVLTSDGTPFVNDSTPLTVMTADGPQPGTDFVIDFGNGYQLPGFPIDGADCESLTGTVYVDVGYWFQRLDGSVNYEYGDTTGPFLTDTGFTFGWGYDLYIDEPDNPDNPRNINRAGFVATFQPIAETCSGDADGSGVVDVEDLLTVIDEYNSCTGDNCNGDLDDNGAVDVEDVLIVIGDWACSS